MRSTYLVTVLFRKGDLLLVPGLGIVKVLVCDVAWDLDTLIALFDAVNFRNTFNAFLKFGLILEALILYFDIASMQLELLHG